MHQLSTVESAALRRVLESQPMSAAKVAFAWRMSAGPAVDRATTTQWRDGVLFVRASADAWKKEIRIARGVLLGRLQDLLGADVVARLEIE
jgi:predicted nucleic acid-binding Zn ribbon protein